MLRAELDAGTKTALEQALAEGLAARRVEIRTLRRLSGGAVQENWAMDLQVEDGELEGLHELVLRSDATASLESSLSRMDEYRVLCAAHEAGVSVPEPLLACDGQEVLGRAFYVMRRMPGEASAHRLVKQFLDGERLVTRLGVELARLHALRPPWPGLECLEIPDLAPARFRIETYRGYLDGISSPQPTLEWALRWLQRHAPRDETLVLCHGDFRSGNYLVHEHNLSAILDWEFAAWSHPYEDIGWFCARCWRFGQDRREAGGMGSREAFYSGYESESGQVIDREAIAYWEIMATARWAVIALQQGERHLRGDERSLELALTARMVPEMELDLLDQIEALNGRAPS